MAKQDSKINTILLVVIGILVGIAIMLLARGKAPREEFEFPEEEIPAPLVTTTPSNEFRIENYIPGGSILQTDTELDFNKDGRAEHVLVYTTKDAEGFPIEGYIVAGNIGEGWTVLAASESPVQAVTTYKFAASSGTPAVLIVEKESDARNWHVLTWNAGAIKTYNGVPARNGVLTSRSYAFHGGNTVSMSGNTIIEHVPGHSKQSDGAVPDRLPLYIEYVFTGNVLTVKSVEESVGPDAAL